MGQQLDLFKIILESGIVVKIVLFLLIFCSVASWTIIFKKRKSFKEIDVDTQKFLKAFYESNSNSEILSAATDNVLSPLSQMFRSGHEELSKIHDRLRQTTSDPNLKEFFSAQGFSSIERAIKKGSIEASNSLESFLPTLASIASVSPFIGLFGTVWGIIDSFTGLSLGGTSLEAVAPGIAEALVATAVGLFAAIPAVWFFNNFNQKIASINSQMESFGNEYLNFIERTLLISRK